jgi:predicted  nucleic acid-binding Zn-ribbon protein
MGNEPEVKVSLEGQVAALVDRIEQLEERSKDDDETFRQMAERIDSYAARSQEAVSAIHAEVSDAAAQAIGSVHAQVADALAQFNNRLHAIAANAIGQATSDKLAGIRHRDSRVSRPVNSRA